MASTDTKKKSSFTLGNLKSLTLLILGALSISLWTGQLDRVLLSVPQLSFNRASDNYRLDPNFNKDAEPQHRFYNWTIERKRLAPDGVMRDMITVNGRSPGPTIEANVGDTITVRVKNRLPFNLTQEAFDRFSTQMTEVHSTKTDSQVALHWHGLSMRGNPQSDGAHGFTSCAYGPGSEHTYKFVLREEDSGTHWWHSHVGMSRSDGLWGTLIVHSKKEREALKNARTLSSETSSTNLDWDEEEIITLGDHYHSTGAEQLSWFMSRYSLGFEPVPESSLINGKNSFDCKRAVNPATECYEPGTRLGGKHAELVFDKRKRYRLRIVNVGAVADQVFSIDAHTLTVIEADGTLIEPLTVHRLPIAPGQRYSVLLNPPSSLDVNSEIHQEFLLRSEMDPACFNIPNPALELEALAIVRYPGTRDPTKSSSGHRTNSAGLELRSRGLEISRSSSSSKVQVLPKSEPWKKIPEPGVTNEPCHDLEPSSLVPLVEDRAPEFDPEVDTRVVISATLPKLDKHNLSPMGYLNRSTWRADPSMPLLQKYLQATDPSNEMGYDLNDPIKSKIHGAKQLVINPSISEKRVVELILNNRDEAPHPFHLHGHRFWVLETHESTFGWGTYEDQGQSANYDLSKAIKRDTLNVPTRGYAVLRWWADNPGVHAFHCHVLVHMASGMAMSFVDQPALLSNMSIPYEKCEV